MGSESYTAQPGEKGGGKEQGRAVGPGVLPVGAQDSAWKHSPVVWKPRVMVQLKQ